MSTNRTEVVVVGGGQAGLATGYELSRRGIPFVILDAEQRTGDAWRRRWDSLRLFTPARYCGLPGMRFPGPGHAMPTKDEMADYLEAYAARFALPVRHGVRVDGLAREGSRYVVTAGDRRFEADHVVVATGAHQVPYVPAFAAELDPRIVQVHSNDYRNPAQLEDGPVLVVGAATSGADIALELVAGRETWLAGRHPGQVPFRIETRKARVLVRGVRFAGHHVLTYGTPVGRKVIPKLAQSGKPLVRVKREDLIAAGVRPVGRVTGARDGMPLLDDGTVLDVANVVWCTGSHTGFASWIRLPVLDEHGCPRHERGVVTGEPGLYFVGLDFQWSATSATIPGLHRDPRHVVRVLGSRRGAPVRALDPVA